MLLLSMEIALQPDYDNHGARVMSLSAVNGPDRTVPCSL